MNAKQTDRRRLKGDTASRPVKSRARCASISSAYAASENAGNPGELILPAVVSLRTPELFAHLEIYRELLVVARAWQIWLGINRLIVDPHLVMQVWSG